MTWLEWPWAVAREAVEEVQGRRPDLGPVPLEAAVRLALELETDYWPFLALGWLSDCYPIRGLESHLNQLREAEWLPQRDEPWRVGSCDRTLRCRLRTLAGPGLQRAEVPLWTPSAAEDETSGRADSEDWDDHQSPPAGI